MKMWQTKKFCRIPRWAHTHADVQSRKHTLTTHVENQLHPLTTPAAAESGGGGTRERGGMHKYSRDIFVKGTMKMYFLDLAMELDQDLKGEAKRAFRSCIYIYIDIYIYIYIDL